MSFPNKAMVMGAGLGQRMRPLTDNIPKPMVEFDGAPLIDHVLDKLASNGVDTVVVNVHYKADVLEDHLKQRSQPNIIISDERDSLLDTGGGAKKALPHFEGEPFIIQNSDSLWLEGVNSNIRAMQEFWNPEKMDCLLLLAQVKENVGYEGRGDFFMDKSGMLQRRGEKELAPFVFSGFSIINPILFDESPDGPFSLNVLWDKAIKRDRLYGLRLDGEWMHIGTPEAVKEAEERLRVV